MARLSLCFLGAWQVTLDGEPVNDFKYDKARALLAYLAVEGDRAHRRESLAALLWPDASEAAARNSLRQVLFAVREAIGDQTAEPPFLLASRPTVQFNPESDAWLDVSAFIALLDACERHAHRNPESCQSCARRLGEAVALYRGDFLTEFFLPDSASFEEWALLKREWLRRRMLAALAHLAAYHERRGQYEEALGYSRRQLELDSWQEDVQRQVMRLYVLSGDRNAALMQYEACRKLLAEELGVEPEAETTALYQQILEATEDTPIAPQRLRLPTARPHRLAPQATPFVGREAELAEMGRLLDSAQCRLLTLTGPGGVGKTRLALQAAAEQIDAFADGVFFVPLAALPSSELLAESIADAIRPRLTEGAKEPRAQLLAGLREKEMLLVLDNFEHLLQGVGLLADILRCAPEVSLLVTSRERLNVQGEWVFTVGGLPAPAPTTEAAVVVPEVAANDAVQLFVQSARRAQQTFVLTAENQASIAHICNQLAGLPLAIELAAAWVRALSMTEIIQEIERSLDFLTTRLRDIPERHRSLWAVFEHSWKLLSVEEQGAFPKLAVFQGGFDRGAAEQVAGASLGILAGLVDKSLLQWHPAGRYEMHPLLQQYAAEKLSASGEWQAVQASHLAFFLELAEKVESHLKGAQQAAWLERLEGENDNLRAALRWSREGGDREAGLRLAVTLYRFWYWRSDFREGSRWLVAALADGESLPASLRAKALFAAGVLMSEQDDYAQAEAYLKESLTLQRILADQQGQAASLNSLGVLAWSQKAYERATALLKESLALRRTLEEKRNLAPPLNNLGLVALAQGDYARAQSYFEEILALEQEAGNEMGIATSLSNLAAALLDQGQEAQAEDHFTESVLLFQKLGDQEGIAWCLEGLAAVAALQGRRERAARLCGAAEALREEIHAPINPAEQPRYERTVATARAQLDEVAFAAAWDEGRIMSPERVVAYATKTSRR